MLAFRRQRQENSVCLPTLGAISELLIRELRLGVGGSVWFPPKAGSSDTGTASHNRLSLPPTAPTATGSAGELLTE